ncbi:protein disabled isoform X3 [Atheta coriaria]|uniref:protein disabled isoform X3 n=1 Tax=Dalotia coriaria TaxID=877792 RepID=UPI0031F4396D
MQTLRKKTSPLKYKNETSRFLGEGVSFKAKLIGILEVSEARGDRMCQEALADLKMAIRAAGEHKQRITINIAIDGLRLRDEKTGDSLYHHPVHKISFIAQDMSDSRAFGYIFGSPDTGHRFFGIKTDKAASQVVIAMRDLFQVVFALKKKEIELAKQHLDKSRYSTSPLFSERSLSSKSNLQDTSTKLSSEAKGATASSSEHRSTPAVADLVDLELELNSLQQGLTQMERITPSDPFGRGGEDPFGDSFTSFSKGILPPPPSSGRDRSTRVSESSSIFSPKTPHTVGGASCDSSSAADLFNSSRDTPKDFSFNEFNSSHDEPSSGDWFTPPAGNSLFEDAPSSLPPTAGITDKEKQHEQAKQDILSQFDVFTELDPLGTKTYQTNNQPIGTGKIKPYVDKKHFFQELKNPPKKVLNDLVTESTTMASAPPIESHSISTNSISNFAATFDQSGSGSASSSATAMNVSSNSIYNNDPFGEDPFDQTDPFAEADFKVFENDMSDYKLFNNGSASAPPTAKLNELGDKVTATTPKGGMSGDLSQLFKADFEFTGSSASTTRRLFDHQSFDMSSEGEAPDPPPRPTNTLIKPPPLPPKKQNTIDLSMKAPPRPPQESHYDYMDRYETKFSSTLTPASDDNPPLPAPARKTTQSRFESDFVTKEDDYLTPIGLLPPPKSTKRRAESPNVQDTTSATPSSLTTPTNFNQTSLPTPITMSSEPSTEAGHQFNDLSLDTLDITLSQLTLSGLNEFAAKLNIPPSQLSNMTLVQLTSYLSNFVKNNKTESEQRSKSPLVETNFTRLSPLSTHSTAPPAVETKIENTHVISADFADFNQFNAQTISQPVMAPSPYDRYAAFRELLQDDDEIIKTTSIDDVEEQEEPAEVAENDDNKNTIEAIQTSNDFSACNVSPRITPQNEILNVTDDIVNVTHVTTITSVTITSTVAKTDTKQSAIDRYAALREISIAEEMRSTEDIDTIEEDEEEEDDEADIDASASGELDADDAEEDNHQLTTIDEVITEQNNINDDKNSSENDLNMPIADMQIIDDVKNDNTENTTFKNFEVIQMQRQNNIKEEIIAQSGSLSDVISGSSPDVDDNRDTEPVKKEESWACFNQPNLIGEDVKESKVQSEEGVSPWSSDSKEFGNGSPTDWRARRDSGSGDRWSSGGGGGVGSGARLGRSQEGWWDTSAEPETPYYNRRSTDSFEDEGYDYYDRPRRARRPPASVTGSVRDESWFNQPSGGHSSSSRDVSPWEEEPRRRDGRQSWASRHSRSSFERHAGERWRHADSWDEDDDYEYEDERFHWHSERPHPRDIEGWEDRRMRSSGRTRRDVDRERWCCPDYDAKDVPEPLSRYSSGRWSNPDRRKHDERYYTRDSQESPWEDEYGNEMEPHYLTARRTRIRPSSATEMDRKTGEIKGRGQFHLGHGSDGERDRRYKSSRRSKSRDSQYSEPPRLSRQLEPPLRGPLRRQHQKLEDYDSPMQAAPKALLKEPPPSAKKTNTMSGRKSRSKESPKTEETNTFPRKSRADTASRPLQEVQPAQSMFENDFVQFGDLETPPMGEKWFKKPAAPKVQATPKLPPVQTRAQHKYRQKSLFEDDFSPSDKEKPMELPSTGGNVPVVDQAHAEEATDCLGTNNFTRVNSGGKKRLNRISQLENNLKKSESVNIFARENDPFDDDFFSAENANGDNKWAHHFDMDDNRT